MNRSGSSGRGRVWRVIVTFALLVGAIPIISAHAAPPANEYFQRTWARTDKPVADQQVNRTWMWGPEAFTSALQETFVDSPGGTRTVQYYDKSRMEISNLGEDPSSIWYVTNGLLVVEMMEGRIQTGLDTFQTHTPADINVAGDADDPNGPTYRAFNAVRNRPLGLPGEVIIEQIHRNGTVTTRSSLAEYGVTAEEYVIETNHRVASVFWEFMNSSALVYENGVTYSAPLFENPFYATGLPVTEAYWAPTLVGGVTMDVLIQCFERRCLTYTPSNPVGWQVEAGNVGRHYFEWRGGSSPPPPSSGSTQPPPSGSAPPPTQVPPANPEPPVVPPPVSGSKYRWDQSWELDTRLSSIAVDDLGRIYVEQFPPLARRVTVYDSNGNELRRLNSNCVSFPGSVLSPGFESIRDVTVVTHNSNTMIFVLGSHWNGAGVFVFDAFGECQHKWRIPEDFALFATSIDADNFGNVSVSGGGRIERYTWWGDLVGRIRIDISPTSYLAVDRVTGRMYIVDSKLNGVLVLNYEGQILHFWDHLNYPVSAAIDRHGNIFVTEYSTCQIAVLNQMGEVVYRWGGCGSGEGQMGRPWDIAVDLNDNVYVSDVQFGRIHKFVPN